MVTDSPSKAATNYFEGKSVASVKAMNKVVAMIGDLSEQINRMEVFQKEKVGKGQKRSPESIFGSALGVGAGISLQALQLTPLPKKSPNEFLATFFGERRHNQVNVGERPANHVAVCFNMVPEPGHVHHRKKVPAGYYHGVGMPIRMYVHPGPQVAGMTDAQHRKLELQPFDGKELNHGLGSGFLEWRKEFVRRVVFAERACRFAWPEDIKVDVLGQHLAGKA